jgi:hypothetical protein
MVIGAVHRLLTAHHDVQGVLLIIDVAHLADGATLEACEQLARAGGELPVLVAAGLPPGVDRADSGPGRGRPRPAGCTVIGLGPLAEAESTALVEAEIPVTADTVRPELHRCRGCRDC